MASVPENLQVEDRLWQQGKVRVAGVDEAGRGPLAGPVVAAAVVFSPGTYHPGIRDSKKLSPTQREHLFEWILTHAFCIGTGMVEPAEIDRINIRQASFLAMRNAIGRLNPPPDFLLIDGETLPQNLIPQQAYHRGEDRCFSIAAASIVAKVTRDRLMVAAHQRYPQYGFDQHKGYGTALHRQRILEHGPCPLHRKSFLKKLFATRE